LIASTKTSQKTLLESFVANTNNYNILRKAMFPDMSESRANKKMSKLRKHVVVLGATPITVKDHTFENCMSKGEYKKAWIVVAIIDTASKYLKIDDLVSNPGKSDEHSLCRFLDPVDFCLVLNDEGDISSTAITGFTEGLESKEQALKHIASKPHMRGIRFCFWSSTDILMLIFAFAFAPVLVNFTLANQTPTIEISATGVTFTAFKSKWSDIF
jgi:hypothetical protein